MSDECGEGGRARMASNVLAQMKEEAGTASSARARMKMEAGTASSAGPAEEKREVAMNAGLFSSRGA